MVPQSAWPRTAIAKVGLAPDQSFWLSALARLIAQEHQCVPPNEAIAWKRVAGAVGPATYVCPECRQHWHPHALCARPVAASVT